MLENFRIIDISQPIGSTTACFPGDTPFSRTVTVSHAESQVINLTAFTMSPHIGTHADAPIHIQGDMLTASDTVASMPLTSFIGPAYVLDVSPTSDALSLEAIRPKLDSLPKYPQRLLFKTTATIRYDVFEETYASFSPELADYLGVQGVQLVGLDTPSVDPIQSKTLETHHTLLRHGMHWLENLDLTQVSEGPYFLVALPLKFTELEASPVRAILLA